MEIRNKKTIVSGIRPTGKIHLGNYFGALKQIIELQNKYQSFIFIADLHALTSNLPPKELSAYSLELAIDFLSIGLNPKKAILFRQSDIYLVPELSWILSSVCPLPYLFRSHAYKQAKEEGKEINDGVFQYPVLMAADILIYGADLVPVGKDQKQHIEVSQFLAKRFNSIYGETFKNPQPLILEEYQIIPGLDGRKMSKSYHNTIGLFDTPAEIKRKTMKIKTDSKGITEPKNPETCNVFQLLRLVSTKKELETIKERYLKGGIGYKEAKEILAKNLIKFNKLFRERKKYFKKNKKEVLKILEKGKQKALKRAQETIRKVRKKVGIID